MTVEMKTVLEKAGYYELALEYEKINPNHMTKEELAKVRKMYDILKINYRNKNYAM